MQQPLRLLSIVVLTATLQALPQPSISATDQEIAQLPQLTDAERSQLTSLLAEAQAETERLVASTPDSDWAEKPAPTKWSVAEVMEHLVLAEEGIFALLHQALESDPDPEWQTMAARGVDGVLTLLADRSQKFQAPQGFQPSGELSRKETLTRFAAARAKTLEFVRSTQAPIKRHSAAGPPGTMNVQQWLALIAGHNMRHNKQIEEALAAAADG